MSSGDTILVFHPYNNEPPTSIFARLDLQNNHPVLAFSATVDEEAVFTNIMPQNYAGGGVDVHLHASMASYVANNVVYQVAMERIGDQQQVIGTDSFAAFQGSGQVPVPGSYGLVDVFTVALTDGSQMDSVAVGELFRLKVRRDADGTSADDDATGASDLLAVEVRES